MGKLKFFVAICTLFLNLLNVNTSDGQSPESHLPINIIVILDTSDRVSNEKHPDQAERDIDIVEDIVIQFEEIVKRNVRQGSELAYQDRFSIVVPDQPTVPPIPLRILRSLTIEDPRDLGSVKAIHRDLQTKRKTLRGGLEQLYRLVQEHPQTGSDIWEWFKYGAESYFSESHRNIVICISDGYLNFDNRIENMRIPRTYMQVKKLRDDPQWKQKIQSGEGLLTIGQDFSRYNIDFLMSEIQLQTDENKVPYQKDFQIITLYWEVWLKAMKIKSTDFGKVGHPVGQKIRNLIEQR